MAGDGASEGCIKSLNSDETWQLIAEMQFRHYSGNKKASRSSLFC
jgi:hypothetical protein